MTRRMLIVAILSGLAAIGSCTLLLNPGKYGMTPAGTETPRL